MTEKLVWSLADSADAAVKTYHTFGEGKPALIPTGIAAFDKEIGGIGPGSPIIIGASTGLGKSSVALAACLHNQDVNGVKAGYLSCEDTADVVGCRLLARASGVDSKKIRRKELTSDELRAVRSGYDHLSGIKSEVAMEVCYRVSRPLPEVVDGIEALAGAGCKIIYLDYIQKIRGVVEDRRNDIDRIFGTIHAACDRLGLAVVFISQTSRQYETDKVPLASALKESGSLETEARAVLMLGRTPEDTRDSLTGILRKSNYGAEGLRIRWERGRCGTLFEKMDGDEF
jgi:replicative DNA helicase